jgi:hypothetical protein
LLLIALNSLNEKIYKKHRRKRDFYCLSLFNDNRRREKETFLWVLGSISHKKRLAGSQLPRKERVRE